jgi:hypothetical protein
MKKINSDKQWELFNRDIQRYIGENDLYRLGSTYYEMAEFVKKEGRDNVYLINLGYKMKLKFQRERLNEFKKSEVSIGVEIIAVTNSDENNCCEKCRQLNGKIFPIDEALLSNPLPVKDCSHLGGCRCCYGPTFI